MLTLNKRKQEQLYLFQTELTLRKATRDREAYYIMIHNSPRRCNNPQCTCVSNNRASNNVRKKLIELQRETDKATIIVGDLTPLYEKQTDSANRKSERTQLNLTLAINWIQLTSPDYIIQQVVSSQFLPEHSLRETPFWGIKHTFPN